MTKLRHLKKLAAILLTAALAAGSLAGCSSKNIAQNDKKAETTTEIKTEITEETTAETNAPESVTITDAAGREIKLATPAEKIVSGYYITTSMLIALGLKDQVVGIEAKADKRPIYKLAAPAFLDLPSVGTAKDFDVEGCAALKPDLVILPKKLTEQADILSGLGINAMIVNPESTKELEETILNIAKATGTEAQADKLLSYYAEKRVQLEKIVEDSQSQGQKPPVVYISGVAGILRTGGSHMYQNELIELAGGVNAAAELEDKGWTNISYEALLNYNPDMIVIIPEAEYSKEDVLSDDQLKDLKAVKEGKVYEMPSAFEAWDSPVTSGILGCMWLTSVINEEQYPFDTFKEDAAEFYRSFYDAEIDTTLITK